MSERRVEKVTTSSSAYALYDGGGDVVSVERVMKPSQWG
jgi:hypothetical protein